MNFVLFRWLVLAMVSLTALSPVAPARAGDDAPLPASQPIVQPAAAPGGFTSAPPLFSPTQATSSITGKVLFSEGGKPAGGLAVSAYYYEAESPSTVHAWTDGNGEYQLKPLPPGHYIVRVTTNIADRKNWLDAAENVRLEANQNLRAPDITLVHGATVMGRILDKATGRPLRVSVRATTADDDARIAVASTDAKGNYSLRLPAGEYQFGIVNTSTYLDGEGFDALQRKLVVEEAGLYGIDFNLSRKPPDPAARPISGKVLDAQDRPVSSAVVSLYPMPGQSAFGGRAITTVDGNFTFPAVAGKYLLRVFAPDQQTSTPRPIEVSPGMQVVAHLQPWPTASGIVRNKEGMPMADERVIASLELLPGVFSATTVNVAAVTDASGRYRAPVIYAGVRFHLIAQGPRRSFDYAQYVSDVFDPLQPGENHALPEFIIQRADSFLSGRVVDEQGNPVKGSGVSARNKNTPVRNVGTDPDGYFHFVRLPQGEYDLTANRGATLRATLHVKAGTSDNVLILRPIAPATQPAKP